MNRHSLLAFALVLSAAMAFPSQTPMQKFINDSFEPDVSVQATALLYPGGSFVLLSANGVETYVVDSATGKPLYDAGQISTILAADLKNRSGFEAKRSSAISLAKEVNAARNKSEAQCMLLTGTDMHDCTDKQSCILACKSNPNCDTVLYSDGFWEAILDWTGNRKAFDSALLEFDSGIEGIADGTGNVDAKMGVLDGLLLHAQNMVQSTIFLNRTDAGCSGNNVTKRCYEYCSKVDYSVGRLGLEKQNLASLRALILSLLSQDARASAIVNASKANDAYESSKGREYQAFRLQMASDIRKLNSSNAALQVKVNDTSIALDIVALASLSAQINGYADSGLYRKAMAKSADFENRSNGISSRINGESVQYDSLLNEIGLFSGKVQNGTWMLGNATATQYISDANAIKSGIAAPTTLASIANATGEMGALEGRLAEDMLSKATQPGAVAQQQIPKLPCLPAFAALLVAAFACAPKCTGGRSV